MVLITRIVVTIDRNQRGHLNSRTEAFLTSIKVQIIPSYGKICNHLPFKNIFLLCPTNWPGRKPWHEKHVAQQEKPSGQPVEVRLLLTGQGSARGAPLCKRGAARAFLGFRAVGGGQGREARCEVSMPQALRWLPGRWHVLPLSGSYNLYIAHQQGNPSEKGGFSTASAS